MTQNARGQCMEPPFLSEIRATEKILRLVGNFGPAWRNFNKCHGFGVARHRNRELYQFSAIGLAVAPLDVHCRIIDLKAFNANRAMLECTVVFLIRSKACDLKEARACKSTEYHHFLQGGLVQRIKICREAISET